jgi:pyruvate/2-oxoacid:ferredoxin oxidoreductase beta subunit
MPHNSIPASEYLKLQGRFAHLTNKAIEQIQTTVDFEWELLLYRAAREFKTSNNHQSQAKK